LFLVGEYAVLDGGAAVVAAVDRGVSCQVRLAETLQIDAPGDDDRYVRAAILSVPLAPAGHYVFAPWNPVTTDSKPGLGGSASATVAAVCAAWALAGETPSMERLTLDAARVHHEVQGSGSGIDVASCIQGGLCRYDGASCTPLQPVEPVVIYSGTSASTAPRVQQYLRWQRRQAFAEESTSLANLFHERPIETLRAACALLDGMAQAAGIAYWTEGLRRICSLAADHGGAAKPSGAGGGDCAVALFEDPVARNRFIATCEQEGFPVIPVHLAPGVSVRRPESPHE
jgi:phosphomevalonate kinase